MKVFLLALLTLATQAVGQDLLDDLLGLGVNTNVPNPAVVVIMRPPVLDVKTLSLNTLQLGLFEAALLDAGVFSPNVGIYGAETGVFSPNVFSPNVGTYGAETGVFSPIGTRPVRINVATFSVNSSNLTARVKAYTEAGVAGISPALYSNLSAWVAATKTATNTFVAASFDAKGLRAIAEVVAPNTAEEAANQTAELAWAKAQGYNAALVVWRGENPLALSGIAAGLKADGWKVLFAYSPNEGDQFRATPAQIKEAATLILPYCDAALLGWRASSIPHFQGAMRAYAKVVATAYREAAPAIPLIGEWFFSQTPENLPFKGKSGTLIVNAGYRGVQASLLSGLLAKANIKEPYIVLVVGAQAYYKTVRAIPGYTPAQAVADKQIIETSLLKGGLATITLVGDGYGERVFQGVQQSDSLTKSNLRTAQP